MYAIIEIGGKSYKVAKDEELLIDLRDGKDGDKLSFETVTMYRDDKEIKVGQPYVAKMKVEAKIVAPLFKDKKKTVFKYKNKTNYRVKTGHRQKYTLIKITDIKAEKAVKAE
ncbi:MAG: 50S ribosomal protein L21 [Brevinematales bacterium]|jgi:large subunit ribosomal protein L21|nr:50S ribosomal protein L21 [Brevinematales bacterium]OHD54004.1 MAG: 50S ribosomal protein L21 [Spirochaetes bacterium GWF1_49_6]